MPKGKEETNSYRVPLARMLQEQKEEARLVPGLRRTDALVFNIGAKIQDSAGAWNKNRHFSSYLEKRKRDGHKK